MNALALAIAAVAIGCSALAVYVAQGHTALSPRSLLASRTRETVIVTLKGGQAFRGVLFEVDSQAVVLRNAEAVSPDGTRVIVDGEVLVLRGDIEFLQRP